MKKEELFKYVDHTALKADTSWEDIRKLCDEALVFRMAAVCIPSSYVKRAHESFPSLNICTVIGFPLGNASTEAKLAEAQQALVDGANEIDMMINLGWVRDKEFKKVTEEIRAVKELIGKNHILKVILETCYLDYDEKYALCRCATKAHADYIKTSTGFGTAGAVLEDVKMMRRTADPGVQIKASGGIRTKQEMEDYINAGSKRIGTSRAIEILAKEDDEQTHA
ncbi:MAG: deoxyribose-phosphate aldolase [Lachnospiraceae bacterium]|nr:deoxyribose-phosphate aldolase [Lachnospiraceae bacterium]